MDQKVSTPIEGSLPTVETPAGYSLTTDERRSIDLSSRIKGWGSDLDPAVRPGVPRDKAPGLGVEALYPDIEPQVARVKIHMSNEHDRLTPVFGTSCPPRGLSGKIRDIAYRFSEGRLTRWMTLLLADRVNVVEDVVDDLSQGTFPNLPKEMGLRSELRYNRTAFLGKAAFAALLIGGCIVYVRSRNR